VGSTDDDDDDDDDEEEEEEEEEEGFPSRLCKIFYQKNEMEVELFDRHLV